MNDDLVSLPGGFPIFVAERLFGCLSDRFLGHLVPDCELPVVVLQLSYKSGALERSSEHEELSEVKAKLSGRASSKLDCAAVVTEYLLGGCQSGPCSLHRACFDGADVRANAKIVG